MESTIKLFKAVPVTRSNKNKKPTSLAVAMCLEKTAKYGFVLAPEVISNYSNTDELIKKVVSILGLSSAQMNSSFHKSWKKIRDSNLETLIVEQLAHYMTTYGRENHGEYAEEKGLQWGISNLPNKIANLKDFIYNDVNYVYIPNEVLNIPKTDLETIKLTIIKGYTPEELQEKLLKLLESGIALKEETIKSAVEVALFLGLTDFERVKNKEVKAALYDFSGLIPENPIEFLRFVIYKATSKTLLIKSKEVIKELESCNNLNITKLFMEYEKQYGLEELSTIFYRFKPIFLALRTNVKMKKIVNKLRRLAVKNHQPMAEDYLNTVTNRISKNNLFNYEELAVALNKANTFRKIRLAYALQYRTNENVESILYRIRNGKGYATEFTFGAKENAQAVLNVVLDSIADDVRKNVKGKSIFIPSFIDYSLPATEKMFTGYFPSGTSVSVPKDMVLGIYWNNIDGNRIDLDFSLLENGNKIGWNGYWNFNTGDILYSGDQTDATHGASEIFYVKKQVEKSFIVMVNLYNHGYSDEAVPFKLFVGSEAMKDTTKYMVNQNTIIASTEDKITKNQKTVGLLTTSKNGSKFYYAESMLGVSRASRNSNTSEHIRKYLTDFYTNSISLEEILIRAGAKMVTTQEKADINLSPEVLEKDTIINLLTKNT